MKQTRKKIVIFGLGSIGSRHAKLLIRLKRFDLYAFRSGLSSAGNHLGVNELYSWNELDLLKPDIAFIANPTSQHIQTALECAKRGMSLFIEKPLGDKMRGLQELLRKVRKDRLSTYVAYVLRFHPLIQALKRELLNKRIIHVRMLTTSYLPLWRINNHHLSSYSAQKKLGGGVVLDLSHEIDLADYLFGGIIKMQGRFGRRGIVTIDTEDYSDFMIQTRKTPVSLHANFFSHIPQRVIQIDFINGSIVADLLHGKMIHYRLGKAVKIKTFRKCLEIAFQQQLDYFVSQMNSARMMNNISDAAVLFKKIYAFKQKKKII